MSESGSVVNTAAPSHHCALEQPLRPNSGTVCSLLNSGDQTSDNPWEQKFNEIATKVVTRVGDKVNQYWDNKPDQASNSGDNWSWQDAIKDKFTDAMQNWHEHHDEGKPSPSPKPRDDNNEGQPRPRRGHDHQHGDEQEPQQPGDDQEEPQQPGHQDNGGHGDQEDPKPQQPGQEEPQPQQPGQGDEQTSNGGEGQDQPTGDSMSDSGVYAENVCI